MNKNGRQTIEYFQGVGLEFQRGREKGTFEILGLGGGRKWKLYIEYFRKWRQFSSVFTLMKREDKLIPP